MDIHMRARRAEDTRSDSNAGSARNRPMKGTNSKSEIPNPKQIRNSKFQCSKREQARNIRDLPVLNFPLGISNLFGIWDLEFPSPDHFCAQCAEVTGGESKVADAARIGGKPVSN